MTQMEKPTKSMRAVKPLREEHEPGTNPGANPSPIISEPAPLSELAPLVNSARGSNLHNDLAARPATAPAAAAVQADAVPLWPELAPTGTSRHEIAARLPDPPPVGTVDEPLDELGGEDLGEVAVNPAGALAGAPLGAPLGAPASELEIPPQLLRGDGPAPSAPAQLPGLPPLAPGVVDPSRPPEARMRAEAHAQSAAHPSRADLRDIQGLVYHSWSRHSFAAYQFAKLGEAGHARAWLEQVRAQVTPSVGYLEHENRLQLALSPRGLAALGVPAEVVAQLPHEARAGMRERARVLGDDETSEWTLGQRDELDVLVMIFARDAAGRDAMLEEQRAALRAAGASLSPPELSEPMPEQREHFGFVDGISQPFIHGLHAAPRNGHDIISAGEIVLGYPNEYDRLPHSPHWGSFDLGRNGSYLVFRKLEQHVERFWSYLTERAAEQLPNTAEPAEIEERAEYLAAKMMGRWRSGASMVHAPHSDDAAALEPGKLNDIWYRRDDAEGLRCPISAHVRRANPRDSHGSSAAESHKVISRHRILRRGRAWGPRLPDELARAGKNDGRQRGLYFISLQTSISRGFEFIQQSWLNNKGFQRLNGESDPLIGAGCPFTIPADPVRLRLPTMPRVVTTRGGGYFFLPSLSALGRIARGK